MSMLFINMKIIEEKAKILKMKASNKGDQGGGMGSGFVLLIF